MVRMRHIGVGWAYLFLCAFFGASSAFSQIEQKLVAIDSLAGAGYGQSVAISNQFVVVGSPNHEPSDFINGPGAIYIYRRDSGLLEDSVLVAKIGFDGDKFGYAVATDGEHIIVGAYSAPTTPDGNSGPGAAFIYRYSGTEWVWEGWLKAPDQEIGDAFGLSVDIHGDIAIVGVPLKKENGVTRGAAYIYRHNGANWILSQKLPGTARRFGSSVALGEQIAIVSSPYSVPNDSIRDGTVYVYRYDGASWNLEQQLLAENRGRTDRFGYSVSVDDNILVIGAPSKRIEIPEFEFAGYNAGSVYVFRFDGSRWNQKQMMTASDPGTSNQFGRSVSISGDEIVVGSFRAHDNGFRSGNAYLFEDTGNEFIETFKFVSSDGQDNDECGSSVAMSGHMVLIGCPDHGVGAAYAYNLNLISTSRENLDLPSQEDFRVEGAYPNPFSSTTKFRFMLASSSDVLIEVYSLLGKRVRILERGFKTSGEHEITFEATGLPSGIYFYTVTAAGRSQTRKMVLLK